MDLGLPGGERYLHIGYCGSGTRECRQDIKLREQHGSYTCVAYGLNSTVIANGVVATVNLTIAAGVATTSIGVNNTTAASASGTAIAVSATGGVVTGLAELSRRH